MKVLVTGGSGMVGRNFLLAARDAGFEVDAPGRDTLDLLDSNGTLRYLEKNRPDIVVHCAGIVGGIAANIAKPYEFTYGNLQIGINIVDAARETGVPDFLNLGSSCMYPREAENPLQEQAILTGKLEPTNEGYAVAKIAVARLCDYLSTEYGLRYKTVIPCNLYGLFDNFDSTSAHLVPAVIRKVHSALDSGQDSVEIWGNGSARREFMYAGDLAAFLCFAIDNFEKLDQYTNVGLGKDYSINEYYKVVADVAGFSGRFNHDLSKPVGMQQKLVDISKQSALGWQPATALEDGIRKTYEHFLELQLDD